MWQWVIAAVVVVAAIWLMPMAVDSMRADRKRRGGGGMVGGALTELQKVLSPSTEHQIEAQREKTHEQPGRADPPGDDLTAR